MISVKIRMSLEFELPERMSSNDRKKVGQLQSAVRYLKGLADRPDGIIADRHHFSDATDAIVTLANVAKRARATCRE
jgi:hypothetical protein